MTRIFARRPILVGIVLVVLALTWVPATAYAQPAIPNPLDGLLNSPKALGNLLQGVGTYLLDVVAQPVHPSCGFVG